jgi:hypothetical protein
MYNRARDATVTTKAGAVVWKFVTGSSQHHVIHGQSTMQQLQARVCVSLKMLVFLHRFSVLT